MADAAVHQVNAMQQPLTCTTNCVSTLCLYLGIAYDRMECVYFARIAQEFLFQANAVQRSRFDKLQLCRYGSRD